MQKRHYLTWILTTLAVTAGAGETTLELRSRQGSGIGYSSGYSTVDYLYTHSPATNPLEFLLNFRGHIFNSGWIAGNGGFGLRYPIANDNYLIGGNLFYDVRNSHRLFAQQVGAGLEFLSQGCEVRLNGYVPVGKQKSFSTKRFDSFSGNRILTRQKSRAAIPSLALEVGGPLQSWGFLAGSPYYLFKTTSHGMELGKGWGAQLRIDLYAHKYLYLGAATSYDTVFHWRGEGLIGIRIPLGPANAPEPSRRQSLRKIPIVRREIIPIETKRRTIPLGSDGDGDSDNALTIIFVDNTAPEGGNGSFEAPVSSLAAAEAISTPGDIIYVFPGDGTARNMDHGITLKDDQVLASAAVPLVIDDVKIPAQTPDTPPIITNVNPDEEIVKNPGSSSLWGFKLLKPWEYFLDWSFSSPSIDISPSVDFDPVEASSSEAAGLGDLTSAQAEAPTVGHLGELGGVETTVDAAQGESDEFGSDLGNLHPDDLAHIDNVVEGRLDTGIINSPSDTDHSGGDALDLNAGDTFDGPITQGVGAAGQGAESPEAETGGLGGGFVVIEGGGGGEPAAPAAPDSPTGEGSGWERISHDDAMAPGWAPIPTADSGSSAPVASAPETPSVDKGSIDTASTPAAPSVDSGGGGWWSGLTGWFG